MGINKRYEKRLIADIHGYLKKYGPTSARAITEDMNPNYKNSLTVSSVVGLLKKEEGLGRIVEVESESKMKIWGSNLE